LIGVFEGEGIFRQTGGTNRTALLYVGRHGTYEWLAGQLEVGSLALEGTLDFYGRHRELRIESGAADLAFGNVINAQSASLYIGDQAVLLLSPGSDLLSQFASVVNEGRVHYVGAPLTVRQGGRLSGSGLYNDRVIVEGVFEVGTGQRAQLPEGMTVDGGVLQLRFDGALVTRDLAIDGKLELSSQADLEVTHTLRLGQAADLDVEQGGYIRMTGTDFQNVCDDDAGCGDLANLTLVYGRETPVLDTFEIAGRDMGPVLAGFDGNFTVGKIVLGDDELIAHVQLVNEQRNLAEHEALYVRELLVAEGSVLDLNGSSLYALEFQSAGSVVNGAVTVVPEPMALGALIIGGMTLLGRCRSRRR
jgi:hypothetical protein